MGVLDCKWMGLNLRSPFVLASLTLFSKPDIYKHIEYFNKAVHYGIGAIVLPSIQPLCDDKCVGYPHVRVASIPSGLGKNEYMGFAVLGRTDNIMPVEYGVELARESVKIGVPIIGSIANVGTANDFLAAIQQIKNVEGLSGIELNFSCPSFRDGLSIDIDLLKEIRTLCDTTPISIKLAPEIDYALILKNTNLFDGLTCSNAQKGLLPPALDIARLTPFGDSEFWRPTGIYGPQEKLFTFHTIWKLKKNILTQNVDLSSVGGFVSPQDAIQAIMLGSDTVQLSSAIFWKGLRVIEDCNNNLSAFLENNKLTLQALKGISLKHIVENETDLIAQRPVRFMSVEKCKNCEDCLCADRGCYAFHKEENLPAEIDKTLCNGCGWCMVNCKYGAIRDMSG